MNYHRPLQDLRWNSPLAVGVLFLLWLVPSLGYIDKFTGDVGLIVLPLIALSMIAALAVVCRDRREDLPKSWLIALCSAGIVLFLWLYPIANSGLLGPGSDRDDALNVALEALLAGDYPYGVTTHLGNSPTPMPGSLILALPFFLLGNCAFQNLLWFAIFFWWCLHYFKRTDTAFSYLAIFLIGCPSSLGDFVTGGDYLINALYVTIAVAAGFRAQASERGWHRYAAYILLAIAISSRPIYIIAPVILAGSIYRDFGARRMIEFLSIIVVLCLAINGPFFLYDPKLFPIARLSEKLVSIPPWLHASIILPVLGLAVASMSFVVTVSENEGFGLMAAALALMFYPVFLYELIAAPSGADALWTASFSLPVTILAGIWIFGRCGILRSEALSSKTAPHRG